MGLVTQVDDDDFEFLNKFRWYAGRNHAGNIYAERQEYLRPGFRKIKMHRLITDAPKGMVVDHINGNGLDNRRENLRVCTLAENSQNRARIRKKSSDSKYKGVSFVSYYGARIKVDGKMINLGHFKTPEEAARAYDEAAKKYFGQFANLNFTNEQTI